MDHFLYRDGVLHAEDVPLPAIAAAVGTPVYVYARATLTRHYRLFAEALDGLPHLICYAVKANGNLAVLKLLGDLGAGMDVVSGGEYARARAAGVPGSRIVFSGVGKTRAEMAQALAGGIRQFNVESEPELEALSEVAAGLGVEAPVALRLNPTSTRAPIRRSRPAGQRPNSASRWARPWPSIPVPPRCQGFARSGSTCISAAS
jgi:diaminopimelate decarboxylase